ncbi:hypothetical protein ACFQ0X_25050 [Streptomyces rectiviolaceus]|uniref:Uncharacterized protein n=1 Tax=Streptomyces rectiviolaceus TaxID=332591 RepID=A0ABP6MEU7_9ACTN
MNIRSERWFRTCVQEVRLLSCTPAPDEAVALAAQTGSLGPITQFLEAWAVTIEIARMPASAARLRAAEYTAQATDRDEPAWRAAMDEIRELHIAAGKALADG